LVHLLLLDSQTDRVRPVLEPSLTLKNKKDKKNLCLL
jgi:hypothetical protein